MDKRTKAYLAKKKLGGESNQRGSDYELVFACYRILQCIFRYPEWLHRISFSSQYPGFVDDLFISLAIPGYEKNLFHQLKTSRKLSWGISLGSIYNDFHHQASIQQRTNKAYRIYLVVCNQSVYQKMKRSMPAKIYKYSSVEMFPWFGSLNAHCIYHIKFRKLAEQLCAFSETDKINALVKCFYACWAATDKKNIQLSQIINAVRGMGYSYLRSSISLTLRDQTVDILMTIPGFQFKIIHGYFSWTFSTTDRGQVPYMIDSIEFRNIEDEIIAKKPTVFNDLELIIS